MVKESLQELYTPHHRRALGALVLAIVVFGLLVLGYTMSGDSSDISVAPAVPTTQARLVASLRQSSTASLSNTEKASLAQTLSKASASLSNTQKARIISDLQAH